MSFDSGSMLDCLFLDLGNVRDDIPKLIPQALKANELTLKEMWERLGLGNHIAIRVGNNDNKKLKPRWLTYEQTLEAIQKYDIVYWVPQAFYGKYRATVKRLKQYRCLVVDLDPKVDPYFWTKITEIFKKWSSGENISGIPAPTYFALTGHGVHLYWLLKDEDATPRMKALATATLKLVLLKLSSYFDKPVDQIHIVQALRVPEAKTKDGYDVCRAFEVENGTKDMSLHDFAVQCFGEEDSKYVDLYLEKKCRFSELWGKLEPYGSSVGIAISKTKKKAEELTEPEPEFEFDEDQSVREVLPDKTIANGIDKFDPKSIGVFSSIIDNERSCIRKLFAKKIIFEVKMQFPIKTGFRNNRMFGASVGLAKCGCSKRTIRKIVSMLNQQFCEEPLSDKHLHDCYVRPHKYILAREGKLREWLGIDRWSIFIRRETQMSRKKAAKKASETTHKEAVRKLRAAYAEIGFNTTVTQLCSVADIGKKTFYRYKNSGILTQEILGYFINSSNWDAARLRDLERDMSEIENGAKIVNASEQQTADQYDLAMTSKEIADTSF